MLDRRESYERIPRFFFPTPGRLAEDIASQSRVICKQRVGERLKDLLIEPLELQALTKAMSKFTVFPKLSNFQTRMLSKNVVKSGVVVIDELLESHALLPISYDVFKQVGAEMDTNYTASSAVKAVLDPRTFLMFPRDEDDCVNGYALLECIYQLQRSSIATKCLVEHEAVTIEGMVGELELSSIIREMIATATTLHLDLESDFRPFYELICTRMIVLRHDFKANGPRTQIPVDDLLACPAFLEFIQLMHPGLEGHFVKATNRFDPSAVQAIHRQYVQLDRNKNGMISSDELIDYGKKKAFNPIHQTPTHDLTPAFVNQVFAETTTYPPHGEIDFKAYVDFTLLMADKSSETALRYFWNLLDFQKQGFVDAFVLDVFLRDLVQKIREYGDDQSITTTRLRTQVFDLVAPKDPLRITWKDLIACRLGHIVVRMLTDYVAYRAYEDCDGRFTLPL